MGSPSPAAEPPLTIPARTPSARITFPAAARGEAAAPLLSGRLRRARGASVGAAVLCHPHPAFGGNMDVWLLPRIGEALADAGWTVLRFDFRSVGAPAGGQRVDGTAETADLEGALDLLDEVQPRPARRAVIGWSFGALVGLLHGPHDPRVRDWVGIAPPTRPLPGVDLAPLPTATIADWQARRTVIVGRHDQHFPPETVGVVHPDTVHVIEDTDHFFFDRDEEVAAMVREALR